MTMRAIDMWLGPIGRAAVWRQRRYRETDSEYKERMAMPKCKRCNTIEDEAGLCECDYRLGTYYRLHEAAQALVDKIDRVMNSDYDGEAVVLAADLELAVLRKRLTEHAP